MTLTIVQIRLRKALARHARAAHDHLQLLARLADAKAAKA